MIRRTKKTMIRPMIALNILNELAFNYRIPISQEIKSVEESRGLFGGLAYKNFLST